MYFFYNYVDGIRRKIGLKQRVITVYIWIKYFVIDVIYTDRNAVKVFWHRDIQNFGDSINPILIQLLTDKKAVWVNPFYYRKSMFWLLGQS